MTLTALFSSLLSSYKINTHPFSLYTSNPLLSLSPSSLSNLFTRMADSQFSLFFHGVHRVFMAALTCLVALGGATVGVIAGSIKGPTTETGLLRGACVGAITGAITALQFMDMVLNGEPFSKASFFTSLVNGQVMADWVTPAVLKAYQWQISGVESTFADMFEVYENNGSKGLCLDSINRLPRCMFKNCCKEDGSNCAICLQNFKNREEGRELPMCRHVFHMACIDEWLIRSGSCPVCRRNV